MLTVNLTTTRERLPLCRVAVVSLLLQSRPADGIRLWISKTPYLQDAGIDAAHWQAFLDSLPAHWHSRIEACWVENTGPYRKLLPALGQASLDDILVTADDDIFYGEHWLEHLMNAHEQQPSDLVACRIRRVRRNAFGKTTSYLHWPLVPKAERLQADYLVTFGAGAVLRRGLFDEADIARQDYLKLAPAADDLWFSALLRRQGVAVQVVPRALQALQFISHGSGLKLQNLPGRQSWLERARLRLWSNTAGYLGLAVCGNDVANRRIAAFFQQGDL